MYTGILERELYKPTPSDLGSFSNSVRYARIVDVYDATVLDGLSGDKDNYGKVSIVFLDSTGSSPVLVPFLTSWYSWSRGSGIIFMPEQNDIVACLTQHNGFPQIIGFLPYKWNESIGTVVRKSIDSVSRTRPLYKGEILVKSSSGGELLLDKNGTATLTSTDPSVKESVLLNIDGNCTENVFDRTRFSPESKLSNTVVGNSYFLDGTIKYVGNSPQVFESGTYNISSMTVELPYLSSIDFTLGPDVEIIEVESLSVTYTENNTQMASELKDSQYSLQFVNIYNTGSQDIKNLSYKPATSERNTIGYTLLIDTKDLEKATVILSCKVREFIGGVRLNDMGDLFLDGRNVVVRSRESKSTLVLDGYGKSELRGSSLTTVGNTYGGCIRCADNAVSYSNGIASKSKNFYNSTPKNMMDVESSTNSSYFYVSDNLPLVKLYEQGGTWKFSGVSKEEYDSLSEATKVNIKKIAYSQSEKLLTRSTMLSILESDVPSYAELKRAN